MSRIHFRELWTVEVRHGFFGGACDALRFIVPPATQHALAGLRMLARERDGRLHVLIETDDLDQPLVDAVGERLRFGLVPRAASFERITVPHGLPAGDSPTWDNSADPTALAGPRAERIVAAGPRVEPRSAERPLTLRLLDDSATARATTVLGERDEAWTLPFVLPQGLWQVEETGAGAPTTWALRIDDELAGCWGQLELELAAAHLAAPQAFTLDFAARSDTLRYYVVASRFSAAEFDQISVQDTGAAAEGRPVIGFDRILPADFDASHLAPTLLDPAGSARIALFQTQVAVARRARGPGGIELHRNGDVLIGHLPQPGAGRNDAQFVVHLSLT